MREIKFRAWDKNGKIALNGIPRMLDYYVCQVKFSYMVTQPEEFELMQFTGLKDKNDKEIYEGDVLVVNWGFNDYLIEANRLNKPFVMEFRNYSWFPFSHLLPKPDDVEVIGNIYENPELLKEE